MLARAEPTPKQAAQSNPAVMDFQAILITSLRISLSPRDALFAIGAQVQHHAVSGLRADAFELGQVFVRGLFIDVTEELQIDLPAVALDLPKNRQNARGLLFRQPADADVTLDLLDRRVGNLVPRPKPAAE